MQLLMRRQGRTEKRQMYYGAHSAFNEGDGGGTVEDVKGVKRLWKMKEERNIPIGHTGNGALLELHDVAGQGPRLVRENVFHLHR